MPQLWCISDPPKPVLCAYRVRASFPLYVILYDWLGCSSVARTRRMSGKLQIVIFYPCRQDDYIGRKINSNAVLATFDAGMQCLVRDDFDKLAHAGAVGPNRQLGR